jgi:hypothetical protein
MNYSLQEEAFKIKFCFGIAALTYDTASYFSQVF